MSMFKNERFFHYDNVRPHTARLAHEFLENFDLTLLKHLPYSSDLAPCDFGLFPFIKEKTKIFE